MRCPYCGSEDTRVSDSRPVEENNSIRRRRVCDACKRRFTTYEKIETIPMVVVKKDNNREPYDRSKIEGGILRACHKRPVSINQIKRVVDEIEKEIFDREEKEISSSEIGELVIKRVHSLDPVAYVRFASVYREFKDVGTFMDELGKLLEQENTPISQSSCREDALPWARLAQTCLAFRHPTQEGAGCARLGVATGAFLASAPLLPRL